MDIHSLFSFVFKFLRLYLNMFGFFLSFNIRYDFSNELLIMQNMGTHTK